MLDAINLVAVLTAAVAAFVFGAIWYSALGQQWMNAAGLTGEASKPKPSVMVLTFFCQFIMALSLAGIIFHMGDPTIRRSIISGVLIWSGFIVTTLIINHRFQGRPWKLTLIDGGHWLGAVIIQGAVIGYFEN